VGASGAWCVMAAARGAARRWGEPVGGGAALADSRTAARGEWVSRWGEPDGDRAARKKRGRNLRCGRGLSRLF